MARIISTATALPSNRFEQSDIRDAMARVCRGDRAMERLLPLFERTGVGTRYFVRPLDWYAAGPTFESRNDVFATTGVELERGSLAVRPGKNESRYRSDERHTRVPSMSHSA